MQSLTVVSGSADLWLWQNGGGKKVFFFKSGQCVCGTQWLLALRKSGHWTLKSHSLHERHSESFSIIFQHQSIHPPTHTFFIFLYQLPSSSALSPLPYHILLHAHLFPIPFSHNLTTFPSLSPQSFSSNLLANQGLPPLLTQHFFLSFSLTFISPTSSCLSLSIIDDSIHKCVLIGWTPRSKVTVGKDQYHHCTSSHYHITKFLITQVSYGWRTKLS